MELIVVVETSRSSHSPSSSGLGLVRLLLTSFLSFYFPFLLFFFLFIYVFIYFFCFSSSLLSFSLSPSLFFLLQVPLSPLPPLLLPPPVFLPYHSIQFLTFLLVLLPLPPFPPWVGENSAKRIIFYGQTKSLK